MRPSPAPQSTTGKVPQPINVEAEYARKYEAFSDEIIPIDAETFRQNVRESKAKEGHQGLNQRRREKSRRPQLSLAALEQLMQNQRGMIENSQMLIDAFARIGATTIAAQLDNHPVIRAAIADMTRSQSMAPHRHSESAATSNKRRKLDSSASTTARSQSTGVTFETQSSVTSSNRHMQPQPTAGPSHRPAIQHKRKSQDMHELGIENDSEVEFVVPSGSHSRSTNKRPRLSSTPMPSTSRQPSVSSHFQTPVRRPSPTVRSQTHAKRTHEIIELSSDWEDVEIIPPSRKKSKVAPTTVPVPLEKSVPMDIPPDTDNTYDFNFDGSMDPNYIPPLVVGPGPKTESSDDNDADNDDSDNDDDDDWNPLGFDLNDPDTWKSLKTDRNDRLDNSLSRSLEQLNMADSKLEVTPSARYRPINTYDFDTRPRRPKYVREPVYVWDMLEQAVNVRVPPRLRPAAFRIAKTYIPPWREDFDFYRLKRGFDDPNGFLQLQKAPGSVNKIVQKGGWTVIASGCLGGLPDSPDEEPSPYNREGSLMTLGRELDIPEGHEVQWPSHKKYYAVNDVQFNPLETEFVSSGADRFLRLWNLQGDDDEEENSNLLHDPSHLQPTWRNRRMPRFKSVPHDIVFKPGTSIFAVAEKQVLLYSLVDSFLDPLGAFSLYPIEAPHVVGAMAWGVESTSSHLFASSEPLEPLNFVGVHKAHDILVQKAIYTFDAAEAGDTLCVGPNGNNLALSTRGSGNRHVLRLYDIARREKTATSIVHLESFPVRYPGFEGEVNSSMFSPDGLFLALGRSDNQTHVYDMRFINRGPIYRFEHNGECQASDKGSLYGVVKTQWIQSTRSRRIALVTGGEDGCVRVWDPNLSAADSKNGTAIAQVNSDIGHFSLGDSFAGEHRLVVGDCSGEISVFDNLV